MRMPKRCPSRSVEPLRRPRIFMCSTAVSLVPVKGDSVVRLDGAAGPRPASAEATVSFFEHLKTEASAEWRAYTEHPFPTGMAEGTLSEAAFRHYLVQDYLFLIEFARAYALAVYKSRQLSDMREAASGLSAILAVEMNLHVKLCAGWGLSPADACSLRGRLRGDRGTTRSATQCARRNEPLSHLDRRVRRCAIPRGCCEGAGAAGPPRWSLCHTRARGRADRGLQGSDPARDQLLGNGVARGAGRRIGIGRSPRLNRLGSAISALRSVSANRSLKPFCGEPSSPRLWLSGKPERREFSRQCHPRNIGSMDYRAHPEADLLSVRAVAIGT